MLTLMFITPLNATNLCVLPLGAGSKTGVDWNNALDFSAMGEKDWARGNIYYIGGGTYLGTTISTSVAGTTTITIKKATKTDHYTDIGWMSSYGTNQAVFQWINRTNAVSHAAPMRILTSYITVDGGALTGAKNDVASYGFKFKYPADINTNATYGGNFAGIHVPDTSTANITVNNVKIYRTAIEGMGYISCLNGIPYACTNAGIQSKSANASEIDIAYNYFYGWTVQIMLSMANNIAIHDNYFDTNTGGSAAHGEQIAPSSTDQVSIYNNVFYNSMTAVVGFHRNGGTDFASNTNSKLYNNIIIGNQGEKLTIGLGNNDTGKIDVVTHSEFHSNTFVNVIFGTGAVVVGTLTDVNSQKSYSYNNLFYNCTAPRLDNNLFTSGALVSDYNAYIKCTGTIDISKAPSSLISITDPFVNSSSGNYRLAAGAIPNYNGLNLTDRNIFTIDKDYNLRPLDLKTSWSIGAYRTGGPAPPKKINISVN